MLGPKGGISRWRSIWVVFLCVCLHLIFETKVSLHSSIRTLFVAPRLVFLYRLSV